MLANALTLKPQQLCRFLQLAAAVGCVALAGCDRTVTLSVEPDLRQTFEDTCSGAGRPAESFEAVGHRDWERGTVVLYEGVCGAAETPEATSPLFVKGYTVLLRDGTTVKASSSGSVMMETATPESTEPILYTIGYVPDDGYALVEGQIIDPAVATVEARFDNGLVLQDAPTQNRFAILAADANKLCDLRVLDSNQQPIGEPLVSNDCSEAP
jgi:hypothetical protein